MIVTMEVNRSDLMGMDEYKKAVLDGNGWTELSSDGETPKWGFHFKTRDGRVGRYCPLADKIAWKKGRGWTGWNDALFDCAAPSYCGSSLLEFLGATVALWVNDEDGDDYLYVEG